MIQRAHAICLLTLALAGAALLLGATAAAARAETYGELGHFGRAGTGHGEFKITSGTHAFGVDTTDNTVYVGDELKHGEYRIQKFTEGGAFVAQVQFKVTNHDGIEGIAVDPLEKHIYVLALEKRVGTTIDNEKPAAGTLYAFSTEPSGEALVPASDTNEGVLAGPSTLQPQSDAVETALLNPGGITVDPTNHDVIILGEVYAGESNGEQQFHYALQRIGSTGALGERYVDRAGFFGPGVTPNSPIVSSTGAVYVAISQLQLTMTETAQDELAQIPSDFTSTAPPTPFAQFALRGELEEEGEGTDDPIVEFDSLGPNYDGAGLSFAPEGEGGTIYARGQVFVNTTKGGSFYPGAIALNGANGVEIGWTGGQTKQSGAESCAISFGGETYPSVAAGNDHKVFIFDPGKPTFPVSPPQVVAFGPGGSGCPTAEATEPIASVDGQSLSASEEVSAGTPVTFFSKMTQANALSVEWNFGDGQTQTVSTDEYQHTEVTHKFVRGGELTVTETIHTDDLATPTIVEQTKISVSVIAPPPTAVLEGPLEVTLGGGATLGKLVYREGGELGLEEAAQSEEATFGASASFASTVTGPNRIETYHWVFGDGESETTATATTKHKYKEAGVYRVELTVTDALGLTSEPSTLTVRVDEPTPKSSLGIGGAGGTSGTQATVAPAATGNGSTASTSGHSPSAVPNARLASTSLAVNSAGAVELDVICPAGTSSCAGTVTLRTLGAVVVGTARNSRGRVKKRKTTVLTLASGTFNLAGGHEESVKLRLSAEARALLAPSDALHVRATIAAHDPASTIRTTQALVTLYTPKSAHRHRK
jgi:PKD repeat protein